LIRKKVDQRRGDLLTATIEFRGGFVKYVISVALIAAVALSAGCAGPRRSGVVIDPAGVDMVRYQKDLTECQQIAQQVDQRAGTNAVGGAVVGGLVGAILGDRHAAARAAGVGGVVGGARGASATASEKRLVVKNCLRSRNYKVLN
jgi:outer membrane lipoprotein SlyB